MKTAANSADPNVRNATFVKGNVTWLALNQVGGSISQQEKELIMSVIGTVILGVMTSGFTFIRIDAYYQEMVKGAIIVAAVVADQYRQRNRRG